MCSVYAQDFTDRPNPHDLIGKELSRQKSFLERVKAERIGGEKVKTKSTKSFKRKVKEKV